MMQCHLTTGQNTRHSCVLKTRVPSLCQSYTSRLLITVVAPSSCRMLESESSSSVDLVQIPGYEHQQKDLIQQVRPRMQLSAASGYNICVLAQHLYMLRLTRPCAMLTTSPSE